jgi:hypothetical protein
MSLVRTSANDAGLFVATALALLAALAARCESRADSNAYFWLSNADAGPVVPVIYALPGSVGKIQVWARPDEDRRLMGFSLDLEATTPGVVSFTEVKVLNPLLQAMPALYRHQLVFDSATGLEVTPNLIDSFLGYSFFDNAMGLSNGAGIGPSCGIDPLCSTASGAPSWRVAKVTYQASMVYGATELFLAIGEHGLWQLVPDMEPPEMPDETNAIFGLTDDAPNRWDVDSMGEPPDDNFDHRHMPQGLADAVIVVASADFNEDGDVDGDDFLAWQRGLGVGTTHTAGDADGNSVVNAVDLAVWRFQFGAVDAALPVGSGVPEPTGLVAIVALTILSRAHRRTSRGVC